jgi:parallel beta-helix repeat protein
MSPEPLKKPWGCKPLMKRTIVLISLLLSLSASILSAATNVPSSISGNVHWDQSGSPYLLQGRVTIPAGSHLTIDPAVQVVFQGAAVLEVNGTLEANGSAAGPAVFNLQEGGLQSEIFINGGEAHFTNVKILSGVFLAKDAKLTMDGADVTKGSGIYLQGSTVAHLKNNKIYGNSTGVVLDGPVVANLQFNTLVQNTYGLYLKSLSEMTFQNNSIHDNQLEVISMLPSVRLGGNYWGVNDAKKIQPKLQGKVSLNPMRTLKDVLRVYVRTQLPVITKKMANALAAREKKEAKEAADDLKKFKQQQAAAAKVPAPKSVTNPPVPSTSEAAVPPAPIGAPPVPSVGGNAPSPSAPSTTASEGVPHVPALPEAGGGMPPVPPTT